MLQILKKGAKNRAENIAMLFLVFMVLLGASSIIYHYLHL